MDPTGANQATAAIAPPADRHFTDYPEQTRVQALLYLLDYEAPVSSERGCPRMIELVF